MPDSSNRPLRVFLCHASGDKPKVRDLYRRLLVEGIDVWLDEEKLLPGQNWRVEIPKAVRNADIVIVCLSKTSISKEGYVQKEIKFALDIAEEKPDGTIFIIPLRLDACQVPDRLADLQWVNLFDKGGHKKLLDALRLRAGGLKVNQIESRTNDADCEPENEPAPINLAPKPYPLTGNSPTKQRPPHEWNPTIIAALITAAATVIAAILGFEPLVRLFEQNPTPTAMLTLVSTATAQPEATTSTPSPSPTDAPPTSTATPDITATATQKATPIPYVLNDRGAQMVLVPAGTFPMGSNTGFPDEKPVHKITLDAFYIDKFEVTNALYRACVKTGACLAPRNMRSNSRPTYYNNPEFDNYPVIWVDWIMASTYCEWRGARLPTEAEWEYAARGKDGRTYPWGENIDRMRANYNRNIGDTVAVGSYENGKSIYGVYDMAGNASEWVSDWYDKLYYQDSPSTNPTGPATGLIAILRGGAWGYDVLHVRSAYREKNDPTLTADRISFRCVLSITPQK